MTCRAAVFFLILTLAACSSMQVQTRPTDGIAATGNSVIVAVTGAAVDKAILDSLTRHLQARLLIAGFDLYATAENVIHLNVAVSAFTPGNQALRMTVGFGAGRGSLIYTAEYVDASGKTLGRMDGQERFTGAEFGFNNEYGAFAAAGGADKATEVLIKEAAKHIVALTERNPDPQISPSHQDQ